MLVALQTRPATQADGVAQTFTKTREVPGAAIVTAVVMARGATELAVARQAHIFCVVEKLLSLQYSRRQFLDPNGAQAGS